MILSSMNSELDRQDFLRIQRAERVDGEEGGGQWESGAGARALQDLSASRTHCEKAK
jgi:hypothetical protein